MPSMSGKAAMAPGALLFLVIYMPVPAAGAGAVIATVAGNDALSRNGAAASAELAPYRVALDSEGNCRS